MKTIIIRTLMFLVLILIGAIVAFMTPLSTVFREIPPPDMSERHIELINKEYITSSERDELNHERQLFEEKWNEKAASNATTVYEDLKTIQHRLQYPLLIIILMFFMFSRPTIFLETLSYCLVMLLLTFLIPILTIKSLFIGVLIASSATLIKKLKII